MYFKSVKIFWYVCCKFLSFFKSLSGLCTYYKFKTQIYQIYSRPKNSAMECMYQSLPEVTARPREMK
jgi:hypothetical protein